MMSTAAILSSSSGVMSEAALIVSLVTPRSDDCRLGPLVPVDHDTALAPTRVSTMVPGTIALSMKREAAQVVCSSSLGFLACFSRDPCVELGMQSRRTLVQGHGWPSQIKAGKSRRRSEKSRRYWRNKTALCRRVQGTARQEDLRHSGEVPHSRRVRWCVQDPAHYARHSVLPEGFMQEPCEPL